MFADFLYNICDITISNGRKGSIQSGLKTAPCWHYPFSHPQQGSIDFNTVNPDPDPSL